MAGAITQSMTAMTFIVMGILRSGLVTTRDALALILGGGVGVSALIVTFDIKAVALHVLGLAGQPWFLEMAEGTGDSLAFLVAALLTFIVQSSSAVTIFGISLAAVGLLSVDQAMSPLGPLARPEPARSLTMAWQATVLPISDVQRDLTPIRTGAFRNPVAVPAFLLAYLK